MELVGTDSSPLEESESSKNSDCSLAGLWQEESFLPSAEVVKRYPFPSERQG